MRLANEELSKRDLRHIFLAEDRDRWRSCPFDYDPKRDLVLTFDFGLKREIEAAGGKAEYLDHLVAPEVMERYNHEMYAFFAAWHYDQAGEDIFAYRGLKVGNAFRIEIWNDVTYNSRLFISLIAVKGLRYEKIYCGLEDKRALDFLLQLDGRAVAWPPGRQTPAGTKYYFPIFRWNGEKLNRTGLKTRARSFLTGLADRLLGLVDKFSPAGKRRPAVVVHNYYPTVEIIRRLKKDKTLEVILESSPVPELFTQRRLPVWRTSGKHRRLASEKIKDFWQKKCAGWSVEGVDLSEPLYRSVVDRIERSLPYHLYYVDALTRFFSVQSPSLAVAIANIGSINCLVLNYCEKHGVPRYLIINGLMLSASMDEAKDATWINSYGRSIRDNYFRGLNNVVSLGDARMDAYAVGGRKSVDRENPTIVIGAAGYDNCDLNSYVAYEFDYLNDVLTALRELRQKGRPMRLVLKIRANGYLGQYRSFIDEYFPDLPVELVDGRPIREVLSAADLYVSIYSQTIFEAAAAGVPAIYYKKDTQILFPPFDGRSELVTAVDAADLKGKIELFYGRSEIFNGFMDKKAMEKYIGPLDGKNLERNLEFIYSLVFPGREREVAHVGD